MSGALKMFQNKKSLYLKDKNFEKFKAREGRVRL
jgi:hypothetical protein